MAPRKPDPTLAEELRIVRKFLRRNNLDDVLGEIAEARMRPVGAEVGGTATVAVGWGHPTAVPFGTVLWASGPFHDGDHPTRVTIPARCGGRYLVLAAVRWMRSDRSLPDWEPDDAGSGYLLSWLRRNGDPGPPSNPLRATSTAVPGARGTTQSMAWELDVAAGDVLELIVEQDVRDGVLAEGHLSLRRVAAAGTT